MNPHLHNAADLEKIAQLEAEVERLTRYLDGRPCEKIWRDAVRVNMGGGRESGALTEENSTPKESLMRGAKPESTPAANPAAPGVSPSPPLPECAVCGLSLAEHTLTPDGNQAWREGHWFQKSAARKEREDG